MFGDRQRCTLEQAINVHKSHRRILSNPTSEFVLQIIFRPFDSWNHGHIGHLYITVMTRGIGQNIIMLQRLHEITHDSKLRPSTDVLRKLCLVSQVSTSLKRSSRPLFHPSVDNTPNDCVCVLSLGPSFRYVIPSFNALAVEIMIKMSEGIQHIRRRAYV